MTIAAHRMNQEGKLPEGQLLPTTVEEGKNAFRNLQYLPRASAEQKEAETGEPNVQFRDVSIAYRSVKGDDRLVFDGLNLEIRRGEKIALIGSNGAGKSTLMKLMVGLLKPGTGDILLNGESTRKKKTEQLSKSISLVYQNPEENVYQGFHSCRYRLCHAGTER